MALKASKLLSERERDRETKRDRERPRQRKVTEPKCTWAAYRNRFLRVSNFRTQVYVQRTVMNSRKYIESNQTQETRERERERVREREGIKKR